jgi:hypothetical protein
VLAAIAAVAGPDYGHRIAAREQSDAQPVIELRLFRHSLFRFPSVASRPRFSHDPVNLAPDCDG